MVRSGHLGEAPRVRRRSTGDEVGRSTCWRPSSRRWSARSPTASSSYALHARRRRGPARGDAAQAARRHAHAPGLRRHQHHRHAQPAGGGRRRGVGRVRVHQHDQRLRRRADAAAGRARGLDHRGRAAGPEEHLRRDEDRGRGPVRAVPPRRTGCPCLVLRTSRFFPEADDRGESRAFDDANVKVNEFLYRRVDVAGRRRRPPARDRARGRRSASAATSSARRRPSARRPGRAARPTPRRSWRGTCRSYDEPNTRVAAGGCSPASTASTSTSARAELGWRPRYDFAHVLERLEAGEDRAQPRWRGRSGRRATTPSHGPDRAPNRQGRVDADLVRRNSCAGTVVSFVASSGAKRRSGSDEVLHRGPASTSPCGPSSATWKRPRALRCSDWCGGGRSPRDAGELWTELITSASVSAACRAGSTTSGCC